MKPQYVSRLIAVTLIGLLPVSAYAASAERGKSAPQKPALSADDVNSISERMKQTSEQVRADLKKARARFEAQEVERKQAAERARQQAIKDNAQRQA